MKTNLEHKKTAELLAEAEELIRLINSEAHQYMEDDLQLVFAKHVEKLERIKAEAQVTARVKKESDIGDSAEGMHAAIQDIVKAMREMTHHLV